MTMGDVNFLLNLLTLSAVLIKFAYDVREARRNRLQLDQFRSMLDLMKTTSQIALDVTNGLRQLTKSAQFDLKMAAAEVSDKITNTAVKTAAIKEDGTIHLPAGSEVVVKADDQASGTCTSHP